MASQQEADQEQFPGMVRHSSPELIRISLRPSVAARRNWTSNSCRKWSIETISGLQSDRTGAKRPPSNIQRPAGLKLLAFKGDPSAPVIRDLHWRTTAGVSNPHAFSFNHLIIGIGSDGVCILTRLSNALVKKKAPGRAVPVLDQGSGTKFKGPPLWRQPSAILCGLGHTCLSGKFCLLSFTCARSALGHFPTEASAA
jgi:hypothetical protein